MGKKLAAIGIVITIAYAALISFVFWGRLVQILLMTPNEIGDFLAGVFGPLAILWLILGYFQQGIELSQNTDALRLQAEELKNSVEQQRVAAEASREHAEAARQALELSRQQARSESQPRFVSTLRNMTSDTSNTYINFSLQNVGGMALNANGESLAPEARLRFMEAMGVRGWDTGDTREARLELDNGVFEPLPEVSFRLRSRDQHGQIWVQKMTLSRGQGSEPLEIVGFTPTIEDL